MGDKIKLKGVMSKGYGTVPKLVMQDKDIDPEAKAIYAYICSFAGAGTSAFPGISIMCKELPMSEKRFHKFKNQLIEKGYLHIERERKSDGSGWGNNIYHLVQEIPDEKPVTGQNDMIQPVTGQFVTLQNDMTNNNSFNNNSSINNSLKNKQQQPAPKKQENFITSWEQNGFGMIPPLTMDKLDHWVKDFEGNESIVVKAIEVASDQGVRKYAYVNTILKNWEDKGVKSVEDIDALEKKREAEVQAKKAAPINKFNKAPLRKETLPDWAKDENKKIEEKPMSEQEKAEFNERLARIQNRRAEA